MAEIVASAVAGEALSRISTFLIDEHEKKSRVGDNVERLEMAHIRMEAALETSSNWMPVTDVSLLRWQKKLKRAADECSHVLERCKRRAMQDEEEAQRVRRSSFPTRIAHATRSFFSSFVGHKDDASIGCSTVQRFERFADGAGEFLKFMEFGSICRMNYMFLDPLVRHLLAGKALQYEMPQGSHLYLAARPMRLAERGGLEAGVLLHYQDHGIPEKNFVLGILLRVSESTDLIGTVLKCLEPFAPHFESTIETAQQELTRIHTRPFSFYCSKEHERKQDCSRNFIPGSRRSSTSPRKGGPVARAQRMLMARLGIIQEEEEPDEQAIAEYIQLFLEPLTEGRIVAMAALRCLTMEEPMALIVAVP